MNDTSVTSRPKRTMSGSTDNMTTVCHVLHSLNVGGAEILARQFAENAQDQFRVVFACLDELGSMGAVLRKQGWTVEVMGRQPGFDLACARQLAQFFRREQVGIAHAHQYAPFFYSSLARLWGPRFPIIFTEHGRDYPDFRRWKRVVANRLLFRRRDRAIGVGMCVRQALVDYEGLPGRRVGVIYNGVDPSRYDPTRSERADVRTELGLAATDPVVMQVARLNRLKDHATSLRAVAILREFHPSVRLVIVGDGEEGDSLREMIAKYRLEDSVRMLGVRSDVPRLLHAADAFLLSSITEGIPLTLIEAMLSGLPCVATRVGGNSEVVVDGETGYLCEPSDPAALAECLGRLLDDVEPARDLGAAGHRRAVTQFASTEMHRAYHALYREMLGGKLLGPQSGPATDGASSKAAATRISCGS